MKHPALVAIVGKPNVGKSTLFNRIVGARTAITHATPGVTRDQLEEQVTWNGVSFVLVDTGGFSAGGDDPLQRAITERVRRTAAEAAVIILVVDIDTGPTIEDEELLTGIRPHLEKAILVVNKVESDEDRWSVHEFHRLGLHSMFTISALHGTGVGELLDEVTSRVPRRHVPVEESALRIAILGKPNVGKSSLANALIGDDRHIVSEEPGTTRDAIDLRLRYHGREIILVDTAGIKRRSRTERGLHAISSMKSLRTVRAADIVLVVLDADEEISRQDVRIAAAAHKERKGIIVVVNKWDLAGGDAGAFKRFVERVRDGAPFLPYAPVLSVSALTGQRVGKIIPLCFSIQAERTKTVTTSALNRLIEEAVRNNSPNYYQGGTGKIFYGTQTGTCPPTFTLFVNKASYFPRSYIRYLNNQTRKRFTFDGTAITLKLRSKET
ncbi:MAG TPA: ribosome biogenesis GTPase Der [Patescibacteria group bacterium]|nr:ribosome biogenesis GTPase Der [Patescibacteria group bacterium]